MRRDPCADRTNSEKWRSRQSPSWTSRDGAFSSASISTSPSTPAGGVADDTRIRESLPTIKLRDREGRAGRARFAPRPPQGEARQEYSLEPVAARLAELLGADVALTDEPVGDGAQKVVNDLRAGAVALLENLRFSPGEEANDEGFARALASYADVYVNDAFGTAHRAHASTVGIAKFVADKGMGLLMEREVKFLGTLLGEVERPFVAIIGGAKVSDKIGVLETCSVASNALLIGGAMANTFLKAKGGKLGRSLVEDDKLALARSFLKKAEDANVEVLLPRDVVAAAGIKAESGRSSRRWRARGSRRRSTSDPRRRAASPRRSRARRRSSGTARWASSNPSPSRPARWRWRRPWPARRAR